MTKKQGQPPPKSRLPAVLLVIGALLAAGVGWYAYQRHSGPARIRNVLLISIDTCRPDRLSCYGYRNATTPNIDAIAKEGVLFESALSPVPLTAPAHSSMFTGTYPPAHGVRLNNGDRLADSNVTLAERLHEAGYQTAAFVSGFPLDSQFGLSQGFDTYDCQFTKKSDRSIMIGERTAEETSRPALAWLDKHAEKPFFVFLHYYDAHLPYEPPPPFASAHADDPYAGEIAYVDSWIGRVMDRLRKLEVDRDTLVVITGDHGESLGEHGETTHGVFIYQSTLRVPLVIHVPGAHDGRRIEGNVSLVDIVPTVLDLIGAKPSPQARGVTLRGALEGGRVPVRQQSIYCESLNVTTFGCGGLNGIEESPWKYIRAPKQELFDLAHDPGEQHNQIEKNSRVADELRSRLEAMLTQMEAVAPDPGQSTVDPEALKRLAALGYMGGGAPPTTAFDPTLEDPKDFNPTYERVLRAHDLFLSSRDTEARNELRELIALRPRLVMLHALQGQIAVNARRFDEAAERCASIVSILTDQKGEPRRAFEAAEVPTPGKLDTRDLANAHVNLALMLSESGKLAEALPHYEQALEIRPEYAEAHYNYGVLLARMGRLPEAIKQYEEAARLKPTYVGAHLNLGTAMLQTNRTAEAIGHFEQVLRIKPDFADAHYNLGLALQETGRNAEAVWHYEQVLRIRPDFARANPYLTEAIATARQAASTKGR